MRLPDSWKGPYWEPQDIWLGVRLTSETREDINGVTFLRFISVYLCLVPCFPVRMRWYKPPPPAPSASSPSSPSAGGGGRAVSEHNCTVCERRWRIVAERDAALERERQYRSLLDSTVFELEWLILNHVMMDGGKDWKSKFDGSAFFDCNCSESGGYMEWDTNAYIHTENCASGHEDTLGALLDQTRTALAATTTAAPPPEPTTADEPVLMSKERYAEVRDTPLEIEEAEQDG